MTAEAEVCNGAMSEAAGIEEKSEFKARSFQDLAKSELNGIGNQDQADDPEDSYVLVTDVGDSSADGKNMASVVGSPRHESSAPVEIELDARNENPEGADVGKQWDAEGGDESFTLVNGSPDVPLISIGRDQDTVGAENKFLEEMSDQNGKTVVVNGEIDPTITEGGFGNTASTDENPSVANGVLLGIEGSVGNEDEIRDKLAFSKPECGAESEIKKTAESNGKIERSQAEVAKFEDQNGEIGVVAEAELDTAVRKPECGAESEIKKADESNGNIERSEEAEVAKFEDQNGEIGVVAEAESDTAVRKPERGAESEIKKADDSNGKIETYDEAEVAKFEDQNGEIGVVAKAEPGTAVRKPECGAESEIKKAVESNGKIERSEEAEVAKFEYQNGEIGVVAKAEPDMTVRKLECGAESEIKKAVKSNGKIERSEETEVAKFDDQNGEIGVVAEAESDTAVRKPERGAESEIKKASNGKTERSDEAEVAKFENQNGKIGVVAEAELDTAVRKPECGAESEIKKSDESNGKIERSENDEVTKFEDQNGKIGVVAEAEPDTAFRKPECGAESEIKKSDESNGKMERSEKDEVAKFEDQNGKIGVVAEAESDTVEDQLISEASPGVEENQESKVPNLILVSESEEEEEPKSSLSPFDKQETTEDEAESSLGKEAMQDQKSDIDTEKDDQYGLDKDKVVDSNVDCNVRMVSDEVLEVKDEGVSGVYPVEGSMTYPEDAIHSRDGNGATPQISVSEREAGASGPTQKIPASGVQVHKPTNEVQISDTETAGVISSLPVDGSESESFENEHVHLDSLETSTIDGVCSGSDRMVVSNEKEPVSQGCESSADFEDDCNPPVSAVKFEPEAHNSSAVNHGPTQKIPASSVHVHMPANDVQISDAETAGVISSLPVDGSESDVVSNDKEPISQGSELNAEFEDDCNPLVSAVKLETEAHNSSAVNHVDVSSERDATSGSEVFDTFVSDKGVSNSMLECADVKDMVDGATRSDDKTLLLAKNGNTGNSRSIDISMASPDYSSETVTKEDVSGAAVTKPFNFFVRMPRYSDEKLQEQIRIAELEVNEKTKLRDSIRAQIQEKRAKNQNNGIDYEYAKGEDRSLKKLLKDKRIEIDSLQSVINKAKNATSIEDLNSRIKTIEHMIQHETLPLKEEKQFIHEIKQLKQLREQLSSSKCSQNEIQQALEQREQAEERLKTLRKELGNLKDTSSKTQTACDEAESKYSVEHKKVKELQAQFRAADDVRQEAYAKYLCLSKELSQKRKNFFKFKNDSATATYYAFHDDRKTLYRHCVNVVENFMELWNGNDEFRSEYVRLNTRSTLRRFGTLDGRSLGPDEKPPILPSYVRERNDKVVSVPANADSISRSPTMELKPETKIENGSSDIHSSKKETESKEKIVTTREPAKSKQVNSLATVSSMDEEKVEVQEEPIKTKEELELIRKAEEIRREEAEAELKEQRRLEEIVKAKEARERKQRRDEKAQKREELKARKETEQKEKEREKKSRKKERKKAATASNSASTDPQDDATSITCVESVKEEASTQVNDVSTRKPKTSRVTVSKQNKTRSVPPPSLRNRNRRKWQQWMWVSLVGLLVVVLFWLGNMGVFSSVNSKLQGTGF